MSTVAEWPGQAETWLDERGKPAWIIATVLAFIFFWPVGLALLAYIIWSKRMFSCTARAERRAQWKQHCRHSLKSSGNSAFDTYKAETLRRLEDEQDAFEAFLQRLREAKDKSEFDTFMEDRARKAGAPSDDTPQEA